MNTLALPAPAVLQQLDPFEQCVFGFLAKCRSPKTARAYHEDLRNYLAWLGMHTPPLRPLEVKRVHLDMYVRWMQAQERWAESTIARRIGTVVGLYKYATLEDYLTRDPGLGVNLPSVDRAKQHRTWLTAVQFAQLLAAAKQSRPMDHALVALLGSMALRIGEACSLNIENLHRDPAGYLALRFIGKGNKAAQVVIPVPAMGVILEITGDRTTGPILLNHRGDRMDRAAAARILKRLARVAGVPDFISPHSLRRTFCTTALQLQIPLYDVQSAMRHVNPKTTVIYDMDRNNLDRSAIHRLAGIQAALAG